MNAKEFKQELASAKNTVKQLKSANEYHKNNINELNYRVYDLKHSLRLSVWCNALLFGVTTWAGVLVLLYTYS